MSINPNPAVITASIVIDIVKKASKNFLKDLLRRNYVTNDMVIDVLDKLTRSVLKSFSTRQNPSENDVKKLVKKKIKNRIS